jgi:CHAT domain-containing protein
MENRFHPYRRFRLSPFNLLAAALTLALFSLLSGYAHKPEWNCKAYLARCQLYRETGDNAACIRWAGYGERQCRAEGISASLRLHLLKAESLTDSGAYPEALQSLAADPPQDARYATLRARRLNDQAAIAIDQSRYLEAAQLLDRATQEANLASPPSAPMLSQILWNRFTLYDKTLDLDAARRIMDQLDRSGGALDRAHLLANYGYVLERSARYEEAARYFELAVAQNQVNPLQAGDLQSNLAGIYYHLGDLDQALTAAQQAESALDGGHDRSGLRTCLNTLGLIYKDRGDLTRARETLTRALAIARELNEKSAVIEVENNLASVAVESRDWSEASALNARVFAAEDTPDGEEARQYARIARSRILAGKGDFPGALAALDEVAAHAFDNPNPRIDAEVAYLDIYRQLHNEPQARAHYQTALALIDRTRSSLHEDENKLAWFDSQKELNQQWVRFLVEEGRPEEALEAVESSRARILLERLHLAQSKPRASRVNAYRALARAQGAALVSYCLMPDVSYAWVVTPEKIELRKLPGERAIAALVSRYGTFLEDRNDPLQSTNTAGAALEQAILEPLLPLLQGVTRVILAPDAQLNALNFETLPVQGQYWIHSVTLTIAPSLNILTLRERGAPTPTLLAIGDPVPTAEFPKLPSASQELDTVARAFPASTVLRGDAATPDAYRQAADGPRYIHFAAHAAAVAQHPLDSAVILSGGRLTARELLETPIHAELVTLSACRGAGARLYHGEGPVGLAWVFLQTGAHGVIAGLWDASDDATAGLMSAFYARVQHGLRPADALHAAKLEMIQANTRFATPYYWAPFQYYRGAGSP